MSLRGSMDSRTTGRRLGGSASAEGSRLRVRKDDLKVRDQKVVVNNAGAFCAVYSVLCILCCVFCAAFCAVYSVLHSFIKLGRRQ